MLRSRAFSVSADDDVVVEVVVVVPFESFRFDGDLVDPTKIGGSERVLAVEVIFRFIMSTDHNVDILTCRLFGVEVMTVDVLTCRHDEYLPKFNLVIILYLFS